MRLLFLLVLSLSSLQHASAQYFIEGTIEKPDTTLVAYLSILNRWDEFTTVASDMILKQSEISPTGEFSFEGNELSEDIGYYKIHFADPEKTPVYMTGSPVRKNYFIFLLSNKDSISINLKSAFYNINEIKYRSGIAANEDLLNTITQIDQFRVEEDNAQTDNQQQLIIDKKQNYALDLISNSDEEAAKLYALYCTHLDIDTHKEAFQEVADQLETSPLRSSYFKTLEEYIGSKFYRKLQAENDQLHTLLYTISGLALLLLIWLIRLYLKIRKQKPAQPESKNLDQLTSKENEVMEHIQSGLTNKEIAAQLFISESTVKTHINNIYRKTKVKSRAEIKLLKK